jgi:membrane protease YdiL (CAAX protease family)
MIIQTLITSIIQLFIFSIIPTLCWLIFVHKQNNYFFWLGLIKPRVSENKKFILTILIVFLALFLPGMYLVYSMDDKSILANSKFIGTGFMGGVSILIYAFIQTGLAEEIFFRGFLNKRLSKKMGFAPGNTIQAILFSLLHGILLFQKVSPFMVILVLIFTFMAGWLMGYMNEKIAGGSIIPGWIIHGLVNTVSSFMFLLGYISV